MALKIASGTGLPTPIAVADHDPSPVTSRVVADMQIYDAVNSWWNLARSFRSEGDAAPGDKNLGVGVMAYNGTGNSAGTDRWYNNSSATLLASAAAGGSTRTSPDQTFYNGRGVRISIDVTAYTSGTLTVTVSTKDSVSAAYTVVLTSAGLVATGHTELRIYPSIAVTANVTANDIMSRIWRVNCTAVVATYSVAVDTLV